MFTLLEGSWLLAPSACMLALKGARAQEKTARSCPSKYRASCRGFQAFTLDQGLLADLEWEFSGAGTCAAVEAAAPETLGAPALTHPPTTTAHRLTTWIHLA